MLVTGNGFEPSLSVPVATTADADHGIRFGACTAGPEIVFHLWPGST